MRIALVALAALAGCASQPLAPPMSLEERIAVASNMELCEAVFHAPPDVARPAEIEAQRRGVNCADYLQAVTTHRAQKEANRAMAAQILMQRQQPMIQPLQMPIPAIQPRRQTNCTSQVIGNQVHTNCY